MISVEALDFALSIIIVQSREPPWRPQSGQLLNASGHVGVPVGAPVGAPVAPRRERPLRPQGEQLLNASGHIGALVGVLVAPPRELPLRSHIWELPNTFGHIGAPCRCAYGTSTGTSMAVPK